MTMAEEISEYEETSRILKVSIHNRNTVVGDAMQLILHEIKTLRDVWDVLPESEQDELIERIEKMCKTMVDQITHIVIAEGRPTMRFTLERMDRTKDGFVLKASGKADQAFRLEMIDHQGGEVMITAIDTEQYTGGDKPQADPDQRALNGFGVNEKPAVGDFLREHGDRLREYVSGETNNTEDDD